MSFAQVDTGPSEGVARSGLVARNSLLNFAGQAIPLLIGIAAIRVTVRALGAEAFGVLTLVWVMVGYFNFLDLGLGQATTKYGAELVGRRDMQAIPRLLWTALITVSILGCLGGLVLAVSAPVLAMRVFHLPPALAGDARAAFLVVALGFPVLLASGVVRGLLAAFQRFDLIALVQLPAASASYLLPAVAASLGYRLPVIAALLVVSRIAAAAVMLALLSRLLPSPLGHFEIDRQLLRKLFGYGGWVTLSSLITPFLVYLERFLIGALASMVAVAQYAAPADVASRVSIFPGSISTSLFPALSALGGAGHTAPQRALLLRAFKLLMLTLGPVTLLMIGFAPDIIRIWLGPQFARSVVVLQVVAAGALLNAAAWLALATVQANGRPDLPAKFYLLELLAYLPVAWLLVSRYGAVGAAWAWTGRAVLDAFLLWSAALNLIGMRASSLAEWSLWRRLLPVAGFGVLVILACASATPSVRVLSASTAAMLYAGSVWVFSLEPAERTTVISGLKVICRTALH